MTRARVISVNVGRGRDAAWAGRLGRSAIGKRPVPGPEVLGRAGAAPAREAGKE